MSVIGAELTLMPSPDFSLDIIVDPDHIVDPHHVRLTPLELSGWAL